jgi:hypothetical protein
MLRAIVIATAALSLAACASLAPYGPQRGPNGQGYAEQRIESDRYRVSYNADLTLEQGYDWFEVTQRYVDGRPDSAGGFRPNLSLGVGSGSGRYRGYRYSSSGVGVGVGLNFQGPSATSTMLEIRMGRGQRPDRGEAYAARDVRYQLSGRE